MLQLLAPTSEKFSLYRFQNTLDYINTKDNKIYLSTSVLEMF